MTKLTLRESIDLIRGLSEAPKKYDFEWTIDNPFKDPGNDPDYEEEFDVGINYSISGKYRPAKITADPGDSYPAEYPELDSLQVFRLSTGEDITDHIPQDVMNKLGEKAWEDADSKSEPDDDRYDPY